MGKRVNQPLEHRGKEMFDKSLIFIVMETGQISTQSPAEELSLGPGALHQDLLTVIHLNNKQTDHNPTDELHNILIWSKQWVKLYQTKDSKQDYEHAVTLYYWFMIIYSLHLVTVRQAFAALPSFRTWCINIYVWHRRQGVIVVAHFLFAHSQGLKGVTIFHLPVTQCLTSRHHHTPPTTHCRQRERPSNKACLCLLAQVYDGNCFKGLPGWCRFQLL